MLKIINPSKRLIAALGNPKLYYHRTCRSDTCSHASHDPGYDYVMVETLPPDVYKRPGTVHSHPCHYLKSELLERYDEIEISEDFFPVVDSKPDRGNLPVS